MLVFGRYSVRTAHVETIGTLFNDTQEVGAGSGLLLGDKFVVTNNHVIPLESNYRTLVVNVRLKSRGVAPLRVVAVHRDRDRDLALLELENAVPDAGGQRCPMPVIAGTGSAPIGTELFVLGFPVNQELAIANGLISNHNAAQGRWLTNTLMNPGNSGGPAFDERGALVGIAVGGIVAFDTGGGNRVNVAGVNYIIPAPLFVESPLFAKVSQLPVARRCWQGEGIAIASSTLVPPASATISSITQPGSGSSAFPPPQPPPLPDRVNRSYTVSETKDDHPVALAPHSRRYERRFQAEDGYRITGCIVSPVSANNANDVACNVQPGDTAAVLEFRLQSGPAVDRWRGWWGGTVTVQQQRVAGLPPARVSRSVSVSETKDDHPNLTSSHSQGYSRRLEADPGYRISSCTWSAASANHSGDVACSVTPDGSAAIFQFRLESGPQIDRWRGWWTGNVTLEQDRRP